MRPTAQDLFKLREKIRKSIPNRGDDPEDDGFYERQISRAFAAALRRRGWLLPENEGYAPGSWAKS